MGWSAAGLASLALLLLACRAPAQSQPPSERFTISAATAFTWSRSGTTVLQLDGPVTITLDRATLTAKQAVIWLTPAPNGAPGEEQAHIALLGSAAIQQEIGERSGNELLATTEVAGEPRVRVEHRIARDVSGSATYRQAEALRQRSPVVAISGPQAATAPSSRPGGVSRPGRPTTTRAAAAPVPVHLEAGQTEALNTDEGIVAIAAWNGVKLFARQSNGDDIEMQAERAVVYTSAHSLRELDQQRAEHRGALSVTAVYLEGDARIEYTPIKPKAAEQRLKARQVYYEVATDRAILLDAILHTYDLTRQVPFIVRARVLRQLSKGEYNAKNVQITSSSFAVPSYGIAADRLYVRSEATGDPQFPQVINFQADEAKLEAFDVPFFYLPSVSGSIGDRPGAMRDIGFVNRTNFGFGFLSEWGLFETLGQIPPRNFDASYRLDYFSERGPGFGLGAAYAGGLLTDPGRQPFNFLGDFRSYFIYDKGTDAFGRLPVKPGDPGEDYVPRGWARLEHQLFFADAWEAQVRLAYVSDPTFMENWFPREFYEEGAEDVSAYLKRQRETEAFTLLVEAQPNKLVTTSDREAEQFEIERLPEIGYHRIGDSLGDDHLTFFSDNSAGGLQFQPTRATLRQQGFLPPNIPLGIAALGQTGITTDPTYRADFRQEIDWPIVAGHFNVVPYVIGRYTEYSNSPSGSNLSRFYGAAGARITTSFWKVDPTAQSDLLDIHQLRHVIEPELNLFTSATSIDRGRLYQYDPQVDQINDTSAVEFGIRQEWQTKRGGPGRWRNNDIFTLDLTASFYSNKPAKRFLDPFDFRGAYFSSLPETSIARDAFNANASWRITDNTLVLADSQYNIDESRLATAAVGILARRDVASSWYVGNRYIADLNSNITSLEFQYQLSPKYTIGVGQDFDVGQGHNVDSSLVIVRNFDRFTVVFRLRFDEISKQQSFSFNVYPQGFGQGFGSGPFQQGVFKR